VLLRYHPLVVVVLRSQVQEQRGYGITYLDRELETAAAMEVLNCAWEQWSYSDAAPPWDEIEYRIAELAVDVVFAPFPEGSAHHVEIGRLAERHHGKKVRFYATYTAEGKSTAVGKRVEIENDWAALKLRALACYVTQATHPTTREHFLRDQHEYLQEP
jgi:hypothetical protein